MRPVRHRGLAVQDAGKHPPTDGGCFRVWCPALAACRAWSLGLPWGDNTIYAALDSRRRQQLRKTVREPVAAPTADDAPLLGFAVPPTVGRVVHMNAGRVIGRPASCISGVVVRRHRQA